MSAPTEKHRERAKLIYDALGRGSTRDEEVIARALAKSEAEGSDDGMKRGLERALTELRDELVEIYEDSPDIDVECNNLIHRVIGCLTNEITPSAAPSQAADAGSCASSPRDPAPIPSPEREPGNPEVCAICNTRVSSGDSRSAARGTLENATASPAGDPIHEASHD